jgi:hypothetical protein
MVRLFSDVIEELSTETAFVNSVSNSCLISLTCMKIIENKVYQQITQLIYTTYVIHPIT